MSNGTAQNSFDRWVMLTTAVALVLAAAASWLVPLMRTDTPPTSAGDADSGGLPIPLGSLVVIVVGAYGASRVQHRGLTALLLCFAASGVADLIVNGATWLDPSLYESLGKLELTGLVAFALWLLPRVLREQPGSS